MIQIFLERGRSRSGKIQPPNEELFGQILRNYFDSVKAKQTTITDIKFVPITINYDVVFEGD